MRIDKTGHHDAAAAIDPFRSKSPRFSLEPIRAPNSQNGIPRRQHRTILNNAEFVEIVTPARNWRAR
jgi:hypothetical protein